MVNRETQSGLETMDEGTGRDPHPSAKHAQSVLNYLVIQARQMQTPVGVVVENGNHEFAIGKDEVRAITIFDAKKPKPAIIGSVDITGYAHPAAIKKWHQNGGKIPESGLGSRSLINAHRRAEAERLKQSGKLRGGKQNKRK